MELLASEDAEQTYIGNAAPRGATEAPSLWAGEASLFKRANYFQGPLLGPAHVV